MDIYKSIPTEVSIKEEILIPYTNSGLALVNKYIGLGEGENNIILQKLKEKGINAKLAHKEWSAADFDIDGNFAVNLTTSDYKKEVAIKNYLSLTSHPEKLVIVCAEAQRRKYENEFKRCKIITIEN